MIISRTPLRISLGGGGTDLPFYCQKFGGFVISSSIRKYIYVVVTNHFEKVIKINYSKTELCNSPHQIQHPIIREALKMLNVRDHIAIATFADLPAKSGLGSSGSFSVGLLNSLYTFSGIDITRKKLAEVACYIEMELLKQPIGKQDQYAAAFGGFSCITIDKQGRVHVTPLRISPESINDLEHNLSFFYTGILRSASKVISDQKKSADVSNTLESLTSIKQIGYKIKKCLESDNLDEFGSLMDDHWNKKRETSKKISNNLFDKYYDLAKRNGSLGGKIIGAGGGGFFMFYTNSRENKRRLRKEFIKHGLVEVRMPFEPEGTKVVLNLKGNVN